MPRAIVLTGSSVPVASVSTPPANLPYALAASPRKSSARLLLARFADWPRSPIDVPWVPRVFAWDRIVPGSPGAG